MEREDEARAPTEGTLDAWTRLDPTGLSQQWLKMARRLPGMGAYERALGAAERRLLRQLEERLTAVGEPAGPAHEPDTASALLAGLLRRSVELSQAEAREHEYLSVLKQLAPDEARILAALGDGTAYAAVEIQEPGLPGTSSRAVLENASSVGRAAGVSLLERVPDYVAHLRALGLATVGEETSAVGDEEYEILLTEPVVRAAQESAGEGSRLPARVVRRTLTASPYGRELWEACQP